MSKLRIEHGFSRTKRTKLQTYIEQSIADDIALMAEWTNNEPHYIINELLRFALTQSEEFQKFKKENGGSSTKPLHQTEQNKEGSESATAAFPSEVTPDPLPVSEPAGISMTNRQR
jgi:hypothetical protein